MTADGRATAYHPEDAYVLDALGRVRLIRSVANDSSRSGTYHAGSWLEPKDGSYQRMVVLDTETIRSGASADFSY